MIWNLILELDFIDFTLMYKNSHPLHGYTNVNPQVYSSPNLCRMSLGFLTKSQSLELLTK